MPTLGAGDTIDERFAVRSVERGTSATERFLGEDLHEGGQVQIELVRERPEDVTRLVTTYRALVEGKTTPQAALKDLRSEGGYGVVRGSLRVIA